METKAKRRERRVRETLSAIFETLIEDHGMEPSEVGPLMVDAGNTVAGTEGNIYLYVLIREIEKRIGISLLQD